MPYYYRHTNFLTIHPKMVNMVCILRFSGLRNQLIPILASPDYRVPRRRPRWRPRWPPTHQNWHNSLTIYPKMVNLMSLNNLPFTPDWWCSYLIWGFQGQYFQ